MPVSAARLAKRKTYPGCAYEPRGARQVERTGAEWQAMIAAEKLRLEAIGDGSLHAYQGARIRFEIYEDGIQAPPLPPLPELTAKRNGGS